MKTDQTPSDADRAEMWRRFETCPKDLRDWAEGLGYKNLESRVAAGAAIAAQAATTASLLLAGMGGFGLMGVKVFDPAPSPAAWGAVAASAYLAVLVWLMVLSCLRLDDAPATYNRPGNLLNPRRSLDYVRVGELVNLDENIRDQGAFDARRAKALNRVRLAAAATPLVFSIGGGLAYWLR